MTNVKSKDEVILEAQKREKSPLCHFCHSKNVELERKYQKYKGQVVLRGDMEKDDSGAHAAFTEQGSSASCKGNVSCTSYSRTFYDTQMATANCVHPHAQLEQP